MDIHILPALGDNYSYLLCRGAATAAVDPGEAAPVRRALERLERGLDWIVVTHRHGDHTAGVPALRRAYGCRVAAPAEFGDADRLLSGGETIELDGARLEVLAVPGHTPGHVAYYAPAEPALWSGDTLFVAGCGRVRPGAQAAMWESLRRLRELPSDTRVYCGHDYGVENLEFARHLEPDYVEVARRLAAMRARAERGLPGVPSTIAEERLTNPFMRSDTAAMRAALGRPGATDLAIFTELRRRKDHW